MNTLSDRYILPALKRGDSVHLGPDAPAMTVLQVLADRTVWCAWRDQIGTRYTGRFELWRLHKLYGW